MWKDALIAPRSSTRLYFSEEEVLAFLGQNEGLRQNG